MRQGTRDRTFPYADPSWISTILAVYLPTYPKLQIRLVSQFPNELIRSVLACDLDLALVTETASHAQITRVPFARAPLHVVLPATHPMARKEQITLHDLADDKWIMFAKRLQPSIHSALWTRAQAEGISPKCTHDMMTAEHAVHLCIENLGVAILLDTFVSVSD